MGITVRSIQRYIEILRNSGLPILLGDVRGTYELSKEFSLDYLSDEEYAVILLFRDLSEKMGSPMKDAAQRLLNKVLDGRSGPVFLGIPGPEGIDDPETFKRLLKAILEEKVVSFTYKVYSPYTVEVKPYKMTFFDSFWYLLGEEVTTGEWKSYALDKIEGVKIGRKRFQMPRDVDRVVAESFNPWIRVQKRLRVMVETDPEISHYFLRKRLFPTQEIVEEKDDGSLIVEFRVGAIEEVEFFLKQWIPYIKVVEPVEFGRRLIEEYKAWIKRQGNKYDE
ncbi:MAG: WYL domain-containing protein [Deltaproteobacteria bacterium]|nr:WYL domain-containing protein [Deltaproteobacteria bacterium]